MSSTPPPLPGAPEVPAWLLRRWRSLPPLWRDGLAVLPRSLAIAVLAFVVDPVLFSLAATVIALIPALGIGVLLFPTLARAVRWRANLHRRFAARSGVLIPIPYRYEPIPERRDRIADREVRRAERAKRRNWRRTRDGAKPPKPPARPRLPRPIWATMGDPATWRDIAWLLPSLLVSGVLATLAFSLPLWGLEGVLGVPMIQYLAGNWYGYGPFWPIDTLREAVLTVPLGLGLLALGLYAARWLLWAEAIFSRAFLGPTRSALAARVEQLTVTRSQSLDAQAAELRRIERDLHDGAQARIVSVGLSIGLAQELLARDPDAAAQLLSEARASSGEALADLRRLVRGICPPVLAERGLEGAVRALALTLPLPVVVETNVPGRAPQPVESAIYFAVAEALANVAKHSGAGLAWIRMAYRGGRLQVEVGDNGRGGADAYRTGDADRTARSGAAGDAGGIGPSGAGGLRGVQRRLAAFDGALAVDSPPGGPTVVRMEVSCELSSPRTSPSSGTA